MSCLSEHPRRSEVFLSATSHLDIQWNTMVRIPDFHGRGLKAAPFPDYNSIDMDSDERLIHPIEVKRARDFVEQRFPGLKGQPITEGRVCQLTFSSDEHFIVDQHPDYSNTWLACAGSGHAFKHGPAFGEYLANRIYGNARNNEFDHNFRLNK